MSNEAFERALTPPLPSVEKETVLEHLQRLGVTINFENDTLWGKMLVLRVGELRNAQGGKL